MPASIGARARPRYPEHRGPAAFTLVELLVASAIALVVMGGVAQLFSVFGRSFSQSQATVDLSARLRSAAWRLRQDLAGVTVDVSPPATPESNSGYFELIEGPLRDASLAINAGNVTANLGADTDDSLFFTTRSTGGPFVGRYFDGSGYGTIESPCAEVAWFCREAGTQPIPGTTLYNLHRRQLLVVGYIGRPPFSAGNNSVPVASLVQPSLLGQSRDTSGFDLSVRREGGVAVPNTLGDLTKRENRLFLSGTASMRNPAFPHAVLTDGSARLLQTTSLSPTFDSTDRVWEDVILTNVVGFDVRVFDPQARAQLTQAPALLPGDPAYNAATAASGTGSLGAYVDLGWGGGTPVTVSGSFPPTGQTALQSAGMRVSNAPGSATLPFATYDTWSLHYEFNGVDDDGDGVVDDGTNGVDDNGDDIPDNLPEWETSPPYPVPLRGVEVRIRVYEPTSKQVRQVTIRHTFIKK
jgi:type II secretory pathway pseudopilin PulG